jgi:hypothetical protein
VTLQAVAIRALLTLDVTVALVAALSAQIPVSRGRWEPPGGALTVLMAEAGAPVTGAPFSAVELARSEETFGPGRPVIQERQATIYRDSLGRVRIERLNDSSPSGTMIVTIRDPVAGYFYELNPTRLLGIRMPIGDASVGPPSRGDPASPLPGTDGGVPIVQTTDLGTQTMSGISVTGTRTTITDPAGVTGNGQRLQSVRERWVSPELQLAVLITQSVSSGVQSTVQLTNIVRQEPDPVLFQVPAGYLIRIWPAVPLPSHAS